ncbi:hypothetical protein MCP04_30340 (plasmid) [Leptolyngbya boryana IU 594]|uniref:hypothetical protein n=1 Tax=Leptolyngbya TaxID=47251 RepID=UPI0003A718F8|nr:MULTISPECIES: hypothetical protein [Leptolyngbya]MBD2397419.1 hypothetical protein [Leptolyngbya sp. FACHB-239]MBD2403776.1 hypothetical protein [Leptolyngbya sp. FACHB-402]ULP33431.1 hypothetical protein MCP04_30340 [Leptolyngbya boryana IU 594]
MTRRNIQSNPRSHRKISWKTFSSAARTGDHAYVVYIPNPVPVTASLESLTFRSA